MSKPRRIKHKIDGWIILDKPTGVTSTQAVAKLKHLLSPEKIGHAGTLDPLATGILPIALGEATKTVAYAMDGQKTYLFTVTWGEERDTDDSEGQAIKKSEKRPLIDEIESVLADFIGEIHQVPPQFSAIKLAGERAYDIARDGEKVDLKPRPVLIQSLKLVDVPDEHRAVFACQCGKGTYVRSLARDMGRKLGCFGYISQLRRTQVGPFSESEAISLDVIISSQNEENGLGNLKFLLPVETVLDDIPALSLTEEEARRLKHGQSVLLRGQKAPLFEGPAYATSQGELIALGILERGEFLPTRVFNIKAAA